MSRTLVFYILKKLFFACASLTALFVVSLWVLQLLKFIDLILSTKSSLTLFFNLSLYVLPEVVNLVLPYTSYIAVLVVLIHLTNDRELVALRAAGLSNSQLALPFTFFALSVMTLYAYVSFYQAPVSLSKLAALQEKINTKLPDIMLQEGIFNQLGETVIYVHSKKANQLKGVFASLKDPFTGRETQVMAQQGTLHYTKKGINLSMFNGNRQEKNPQTGKVSVLSFKQTNFALQQNKAKQKVLSRHPANYTLTRLFSPPEQFDERTKKIFKAQAHQRITSVILVFLYCCIAMVFLLKAPYMRSSATNYILRSASAVAFLQVLQLFCFNALTHYKAFVPSSYFFLGTLICVLFLSLDKTPSKTTRIFKT